MLDRHIKIETKVKFKFTTKNKKKDLSALKDPPILDLKVKQSIKKTF